MGSGTQLSQFLRDFLPTLSIAYVQSSSAQCDFDLQASDTGSCSQQSSYHDNYLCQRTLKSHHTGQSFRSDISICHHSICTRFACLVLP